MKWGSNGGNRGDGGYGCYWRSCLHHVMCKREGWGECSGVCMKERERAGRGRRGEGRRRALRKKAGSINDINQQYLRPPDQQCSPDKRAEEQP